MYIYAGQVLKLKVTRPRVTVFHAHREVQVCPEGDKTLKFEEETVGIALEKRLPMDHSLRLSNDLDAVYP